MSEALEFVILCFGAYRLAHIITREEGPFAIFQKLRGLVGQPSKSWFAAGFNCILCVSFWTAGAFALILYLPWFWWFGIAGGAEMIDTWERLK